MTKKLIVANWKMNGSIAKVQDDLNLYQLNKATNKENVVIALPYIYLYQGLSNPEAKYKIASQNVSQYKDFGAYTGEVSNKMLVEFRVCYTIIGHSERRTNLGETDTILAKKLKNALDLQITPIFCIGEAQDIRDSGQYSKFLLDQLQILQNINIDINQLIIAYEPIWAIGTGKIPTVVEIAEIVDLIHSFVQKTLPRAKILVLYGGSVTGKNIAEILQIEGIAGVLVGGASLKVDEFTSICAYA